MFTIIKQLFLASFHENMKEKICNNFQKIKLPGNIASIQKIDVLRNYFHHVSSGENMPVLQKSEKPPAVRRYDISVVMPPTVHAKA